MQKPTVATTSDAKVARYTDEAALLMTGFAERTGLTTDRPQRRYLWTDAFAVCNFIELARRTADDHWKALAFRLVDEVHQTLGKHRSDDRRRGWLSGLSEPEGALHPTRGGLRIGKPLPERRGDESLDEHLEWNRDGQYFHYLTKWMHALDQLSRFAHQPQLNLWARELAEAAYEAFTRPSRGGQRRLVWKMSVDLSRPLVASMGHHDPLDGLITAIELRSTALVSSRRAEAPTLTQVVAALASMVSGGRWETMDPLGIGGLLTDACRVAQLVQRDAMGDDGLLATLLDAARASLRAYERLGELSQSAGRRLAFRELGLAIGVAAIEPMGPRAAELRPSMPLGEATVSFWLKGEHRQARSWAEHQDINDVMLATSLIPEGFLILRD